MTQAYMIESVFPWLGRERFYLAAESTASLLRETLTEARFAVWELDGRSLLDDQSLHWHVNQWLNLPQTCLPAPRVDADALRFFKADVPVRVAVLWHHPERTASRRLQLTAISYIAHTLPAVLHEYGGRSFAQLELFLLSDEPGYAHAAGTAGASLRDRAELRARRAHAGEARRVDRRPSLR